jgi:hypothetical protein
VGYEVLDAGRAGERDVADHAHGPVDVVALDELPLPEAGGGPRVPRQLPPWVRSAARQLTPTVAAALAVAVLTGLGAGTWVTHRRAEAAQEARARGVVSAFAVVAGVDTYPSDAGQVADFTLRVFNVGDRPVTVAVSDARRRGPTPEPVFSLVTGDGTLRPGRDALVRARVTLDCDGLQALRLQVPVRSADGRLHDVPVRDDEHVGISQSPQALCSRDEYVDPLPVRLTGSLRDPVLELTNSTEQPLTISLDSGSPLTQASSEYLALTTRPALPLVIAPNSTRRLALQLAVQGCHRDLGPLSDGGLGYLGLRIEGNPDGVVQTGVDLSALVGAALERSCR